MTAKNISRNYFDFSNLFVHILFQSTIFSISYTRVFMKIGSIIFVVGKSPIDIMEPILL